MPQLNKPLLIEAFKAEADLSALQNCAVMFGTAEDQVKAPTGAGVAGAGILQNKPSAAGKVAQVVLFGPVYAKAAGVWARGDDGGRLRPDRSPLAGGDRGRSDRLRGLM